MELPVLSDGVTFDTGAADVSKIKLTTGATWTSIANAGDSDIQFQVPSVAGKINDLLLNKKAETVTMTATIDGETYEGEGYNIVVKTVKQPCSYRMLRGIATSSASRISRGTLMYLFLR